MTYKVVSRPGAEKPEDFHGMDIQLVGVAMRTEDDVIKNAHDADAVIVGMEPYTRRVIESMTKCKVISRRGVGYDTIDIEAATEQGIPVAYVPDANTTEVSDHAMALLLCLSRRILPISEAVREGAWQPGRTELQTIRAKMMRLSGQTLGLVGLGRIGSTVCGKAKAFGIRVIVHDPYVPDTAIKKIGAEKVSFDQILAESDFISLHCPLTKENRHLFGLEQFKKMKPTAYLINTARGGLVNEEALAAALSQGNLAGAALDVTEPEPPKPDNPLIKMKNVMITAHSAFLSEESSAEMGRRATEAVLAALKGQWPRDLVNPEVKDRPNRRLK